MLFQRGKPYSQDLRERVFAAADEGDAVGRIAAALRVSVSYVSKVLSRRRLSGVVTALPQTCHVLPKLSALEAVIRAEVAARPDATIDELRSWVLTEHNVSVSTGVMWKTLKKLDLRLKKSRCAPPSKTARTSPAHAMSGAESSRPSTRKSLSSLTKHGLRRT